MPQILDDSKVVQKHVAKAIYDNVAESAEELPFRKNDLLIVLEQNTAGLPGWWLCSFKGRQGICPGNRLRLLSGVYDCSQSQKSDDICDTNDLLRVNQRLSWHAHSNQPSTSEYVGKAPQSFYKYDMRSDENSDCRYDIPPFGQPIHVSTSDRVRYGNISQSACESQRYDIPRSICSVVTRSPIDSATCSGHSSTPCSVVVDYDVPSFQPLSISALHSPTSTWQENNKNASNSTSYDVPLRIARELPLELRCAVETLERLQKEVTGAIDMLLSYAAPLWRETDKFEPKVMDIKLAVLRLRSALHDLSEFGEGVLGNALNASNGGGGLVRKLGPLTKALFETNNTVRESAELLENYNWSVQVSTTKQSSASANANSQMNRNFDPLDQLIVCARSLTEDVRRFASFVQGNATLLFQSSSSSKGNGSPNNIKTKEDDDDGDYVNFESRKTLNETNSQVRCLLSHDMRKSFDFLIKEAENGNTLAQLSRPIEMSKNDKQVLSFYAIQCSTHSVQLTHAIDAFLHSVEHNQPPKVFLAHGKFVILNAHRMVHIGDTVYRNLTCAQVNSRVTYLSDALSEALASAVHRIRKAAVQFPSVVAVQDMVNGVVDVSHLATDLKTCLVIASQT